MDLEIRKQIDEGNARKQEHSLNIKALLNTKHLVVPYKPDHEWREFMLVTEGDEMHLSIDGKVLVRHRTEGLRIR